MPSDENNNINLLPHDLQRMRKKIKRSLAAKTEYTDPKATEKEAKAEKKGAKKSFFRRLFYVEKKEQSKPKIAPRDLPQGKPLPSAMFSSLVKNQVAPAPIITKPVQNIKPILIPNKKPIQNQEAEKKTTAEITDAPVHRISGFDVNLLSQEYSRAFRKINPVSIFLTYLGLTMVFIGLIFSILYVYQIKSEQRISKIEQVKEALKQTIATYNEIESQDSALRAKVDIVEKLLKKHVSWNEFLIKLEKETIPEISYLNMAASLEGKMSISAFAKDYSSLARQIMVFQNAPWIKDLSVTSAALVEETPSLPGGVSFDMQITIDKEALYSKQ